jgi:hypothetical protein
MPGVLVVMMMCVRTYRRARLVGEWQNYGVLMALIAGFAVQIYMDPPQTKVDGNATWMPTLFGVFIVVALASNFFGILLTLSFYRALNSIPERKNKKFIRSFSFVLGVPTLFLMLGVICFCAAMVVAARLLYDEVRVPFAGRRGKLRRRIRGQLIHAQAGDLHLHLRAHGVHLRGVVAYPHLHAVRYALHPVLTRP